MKRIVPFFVLVCFLSYFPVQSQTVLLGGDTSVHIQITTSNNLTPQYWTLTASGDKTINKIGLEGPLMEASRFLSQATLGAGMNTMQYVADHGIENWIDEQLAM